MSIVDYLVVVVVAVHSHELQPVMMMILMRIILLIKIMGLPKVTTQFMYKPYGILKIVLDFNVEDTI